jgi:hypothetical protein
MTQSCFDYQLDSPGADQLTDQEGHVQPLGVSPNTSSLACFPISGCSGHQLLTSTVALRKAHLHLLGLPYI